MVECPGRKVGEFEGKEVIIIYRETSAMMHIDSQANILPSWSETPIAWNIMAFRKGEKSAAL